MDTWLLMLIIVTATIVLLIIGVAIAIKLMNREQEKEHKQELKEQKRSIYASKELNKMSHVGNFSNQYTNLDGVSKQYQSKNMIEEDEILRVDLKEKRIWKEKQFENGVKEENKIGSSTQQNSWQGEQVKVNPIVKSKIIQEKPQNPPPKVVKPQKQIRLGAFSQMNKFNHVYVQPTSKKENLQSQQENKLSSPLQKPIQWPNNLDLKNQKGEQEPVDQNIQNGETIPNINKLKKKMSETEYMFHTNNSMNRKVIEWQQKAVSVLLLALSPHMKSQFLTLHLGQRTQGSYDFLLWGYRI